MRRLRTGHYYVLIYVLFAVSISFSQDKSAASTGTALSAGPSQIVRSAANVKAEQGAPITYLTNEAFITLDSAGRAVTRAHRVYRIESNAALPWATMVKANWPSWRQKKPIVRARVIAPSGSVAVLDPAVLSEAPAHDQRPILYEDERSLSGPLPSVGVGSIVEEEIITEDTAPVFDHGTMGRFYLGGAGAARHTLLEIRAPEGPDFHYKIRGTPSVQTTIAHESGSIVLRFEAESAPAAAPRERDLPADVDSFPAVDFSTGSSWQAVSAGYYQEIASAIRPGEVSDLLAGTSALKGQELIRRIVTNLHKRVRYTGLEFGASVLIPTPAGTTVKRGYGDCKDKAVALMSGLQAAGIPAQLALLNTRGDDDVSPQLAGIGLFNHAIVYVPGPPEMWIDATAEFLEPGYLPWHDQERLALLIGASTRRLVRTPLNKPEENAQIVRREFYLRDYGPSKIVETFEPTGEQAAALRQQYGLTDTEKSRQELDSLVRYSLLTEGISSAEHTAGDDLTQPFRLKLTVDQGHRGSSFLSNAGAAIRYDDLLWGYPYYVQDADEDEPGDGDRVKDRTNDIEIQPFVTEWRFRIVPPPGFDHPELPKDVTRAIGPGLLKQQYRLRADGSVDVVWRFDSVKARYTPAELQGLERDARELMKLDSISLTFYETGAALLTQGKPREALAYYSDLIRRNPHKAIYHLYRAEALRGAGLGDEARREARRATELEPKSVLAWTELAEILQCDEFGRKYHRGLDYAGAVLAFRKAIELDPKLSDTHLKLAVLLDHDPSGTLYSREARLDEAVAEYRATAQLKPELVDNLADNLLYALFYSQKWAEVVKTVHSVPASATRQVLALAAIAASQNIESALAYSQRIDEKLGSRHETLVAAASCLVKAQRYREALALLNAAVTGPEDSSRLRVRIDMLQNARPYEQVLFPASDPRRVVQDFYLLLLNPLAQPADWYGITALEPADQKASFELVVQTGERLRKRFTSQEVPLPAARDIVLSNLKMAVQGDEASGFRIMLSQTPNDSRTILIATRNSKHVLLAIDSWIEMVGTEVLRRIEANDLQGARQWLDWTREQARASTDDDPLGGVFFLRFWSRGDEPDRARMRLAALSLLGNTSAISAHLAELEATRSTADPVTAVNIDLVLAQAAFKLANWKLFHETSLRLLAARPMSDKALGFAVSAAVYSRDWEMGEKAIADRLARAPDQTWALRQEAALEQSRREFAKAREIERSLIDQNRATIDDVNDYTWNALFLGNVTDEDIALMRQATSGKKIFEVSHTLACLYADMGKTKEARDVLLQAMDAEGMDQPNEAIWLAFGRIAAEYGLSDVATSLYQRVSDTPYSVATSPFSLAQLWERKLAVATPGATRAAMH